MKPLVPETLRALIVEDNLDHLRIVRHSLAKLDPTWELASVSTMDAALARLSQPNSPRFAVILLDLNLPDGTGLDTLRRLRAHSADTPVIVLTGDDNTGLAIEAVREGAEDYIVKQEMSGRGLIRAIRYAMERDRLRRELVHASMTDELTGLHNRRAFLTLSRQQLAIARRSGQPMLLLFADLDGLKVINDTLGHEAGDRAIVRVADALRACFRDSDVVSRLGGDEFAVLMPESTPEAAYLVGGRLNANLEDSGLFLSTGVSRLPPASDLTLEALMVGADQALYASKRSKKKERVNVLV